jgi:hypothetical protein
MPLCKNCGEEVGNEVLFCSACGSKIPPKPIAIFCSMCGTKADNPSARFCASCGAPLNPPTESNPETQISPPTSETYSESAEDDGPQPRTVSTISFVLDAIQGVDLLPDEKILRITPCRIKTFAQVKGCALYTTNQRLVCVAMNSGMSGTVSKLRGRDVSQVDSIITLRSVLRTEISDGKLKVSYINEEKRTNTKEYVIGSVAKDLGDFILRARQGLLGELSSPLTDEYDDTEVKSAMGKGLSITGKALYQGARVGARVTYAGAKVGAKISNQLLQQYLKESASDFQEAAEEEDVRGWTGTHGPKGRKAEGKVAEVLRITGWRIVGRNVILQAREIDMIAEKAASRYLIECKFGRKQIDTALLDSYVMLYFDAKRSLGVNGLLFVCPTSGMSEHARSNVLIKYRGERIDIIDSRNWVREIEQL